MNLINLFRLSEYHTKLMAYLKKIAYVHPETHPASMIVQDKFNKFVTESQIERWNNKLDADANAASASKLSKPVKINGISFDGTKDISFDYYGEHSFFKELNPNENQITIDPNIQINENSIIYIFLNGIKLYKTLYQVDYEKHLITLTTPVVKKSEVEVIATKIPNNNQIIGILPKNTKEFNLTTTLNINPQSKIYVFANGIKLINNKHYNIDHQRKVLILNTEYKTEAEVEVIITKE